ncbi:MAG TPA: LPS assembly lipoprotein LptE [Cellvibrio sp.]|nr:LPS assembly lipoprotein LptE [Cellvibrio sp.]
MKNIIVSLLVFTLSACGWHLRGSATGEDKLAMTTPMDLVIITKDDHSPVINALRQSLRNYKITEVSAATANSLTLNMERELFDKRTAGVGSDALTSAYEITLRVGYSVSNASGIITPLNTIARVSRTYNYNVDNANSAAQEEELVLNEMRRELAQTILRRVKNLGAKASSAPAAPAAQ